MTSKSALFIGLDGSSLIIELLPRHLLMYVATSERDRHEKYIVVAACLERILSPRLHSTSAEVQ